MKPRGVLHWYLVPAVVLLMGVVASVFTWRAVDANRSVQFQTESQDIERRIQSRMRSYRNALVQTRGFAMLVPALTRENFHEYIRNIDIPTFFPGIQGIGWARYLRDGEVESFTREARKSSFPDFTVRPPGRRGDYLSILYLEPLDARNRAALGYDMMSEPIRREAIEKARDTGDAAMSGRVTLVQEIDEAVQPGFLLYKPLYRRGAPLKTLAQRRAAFLGTIYAPFRAHDLFSSVFSGVSYSIAFGIYDGTVEDPETLLYSTESFEKAQSNGGSGRALQIDVSGRKWTVRVYETSVLRDHYPRQLPLTILAATLLVTLLTMRINIANRRRFESRTAALAAESRLREELQKRADENARLYREARNAIATRDEVMAIVSHDLRNPLSAILLDARLMGKLLEKQPGLPNVRAVIERIQRAGVRMNQLIEDLLDVARLESGTLKLERQPVETGRFIREVLEVLVPQANERSIDLRVETAGFDQGHQMWVDGKRVAQVFLNLVGNALKFTPEGGTVTARAEMKDDGTVLFSVSDTGKGIAPEDLTRVFERFWIKDPRKRGTGLGLFIADQIIRAHGGKIWVTSELGRGSTFWFTLGPSAVRSISGLSA